jgi:choline dehydrogenase
VIAARLSEDEGARVLLLEAGSRHPSPAMAVPRAWPSLQGDSGRLGRHHRAAGRHRKTMHRPRGRGLGGSSAINAMNFVRGHGADPQQRDGLVVAGRLLRCPWVRTFRSVVDCGRRPP